ncbi:MAG: SMI1/KNR4 family protein [Pseudohongiella sp.]|uniref:SMI1/KNR4 family protein n=1 Tax=Pseudohongiella sp. TaxID=1979412 RepID=UPI00349FE2F1
MEDVIEMLRERNETIPVPLELPDDDLLVEIEEQLLMSLPDDFRDYLLEVSDVVFGSLEPVTAADPRSHTFLPEVAAQAWNDGMPRYLLPVCQLGDGYYCTNADGEVRFWNGSKLGKDPHGNKSWPSIWHWAREVWLEDS